MAGTTTIRTDAEHRSRLQNLRAEIERIEALGTGAADVVELDQSKVGRLSRMDALQSQAVAQASAARRAELKRNVDAAVARLDAGDYGDCARCGEPIDPRRLDADPTALHCIRCASELEG